MIPRQFGWFWLLLLVIGCSAGEELDALKTPRYGAGKHAGAAYCGTCHPHIFQQWKDFSRHSVAMSTPGFDELLDLTTGNPILNLLIGKDGCYSCHGSEAAGAGVDCETCHGPAPQGVEIMEAHRTHYTPRRRLVMTLPDFCSRCHELQPLLSTYSDWKNSGVSERCQDCHMPVTETGKRFHGFQTLVRNPGLYDGDIVVSDIVMRFPVLQMTVVNRVRGHAIPAGGPTRVLALEVTLIDPDGAESVRRVETFAKFAKLFPFVGVLPTALERDTRLGASEARNVTFEFPERMRHEILGVRVLLRFYEVPEQAKGDIEKARWVSAPVFDQTVMF